MRRRLAEGVGHEAGAQTGCQGVGTSGSPPNVQGRRSRFFLRRCRHRHGSLSLSLSPMALSLSAADTIRGAHHDNFPPQFLVLADPNFPLLWGGDSML